MKNLPIYVCGPSKQAINLKLSSGRQIEGWRTFFDGFDFVKLSAGRAPDGVAIVIYRDWDATGAPIALERGTWDAAARVVR